jgi:tetratricopeptide (TPR) repeat protein
VRALQAITRVQITVASKDALKSVKQAIAALETIVAEQANILDGAAITALGRYFYELRSFNGGDNIKALALLEQAHRLNPQNIQTARYLVEAYDKEMDTEKAIALLLTMSTIALPGEEHWQTFADELRAGVGLAERLNADELAKEFAARRAELLRTQPQLLSRFIEAQHGHFGEHPLTGKKD